MTEIGNDIFKLAQADSELTKLVGNRVYPVIADDGTNYPFIIYRRSSMTSGYDKDSNSVASIVEVRIVGNTYSSAAEVADKTIAALHHKHTASVDDIILSGASETWQENGFIQTLTFKVWHRI